MANQRNEQTVNKTQGLDVTALRAATSNPSLGREYDRFPIPYGS